LVGSIVSDLHGTDIHAVLEMEEPTKVYDRQGSLLCQFYEKKRDVVPLSEIPKQLREAILAIEDRNFYHHSGFDVRTMTRAALVNISSGQIKQGGSTLTQQLARNAFLSSERSLKRKVQELWLAARIEAAYSKDQILELYANRIYLGSGYYGVGTAARGYFGKSVSELSLEEAALLAGLAKAPTLYSPHNNPSQALRRRNQVLDAMATCGFITSERVAAAKETPLRVAPRKEDAKDSNYAIEYVKRQLLDMFGYDKTFTGGLRVYTTIDADTQAKAQAAVESHLSKIEAQPGFRHLPRAKYLEQQGVAAGQPIPDEDQPDYLQGALICMDAHSGEVYALVGGRNFQESKFNRAVQAKRQPGSAFKPFVYVTALKSGMTPATLVDGQAMEFATADGIYRTANAEGVTYGPVTLRTALRKSINTVSIRLGQQVGIRNIIRTARAFGIKGELPAVISLPLGAGEVTLLEMVQAYSAFPNAGNTVEPTLIDRVESKRGEVLYQHHPVWQQAIDKQTAFLLTTMLTDAVDRGTGRGVRAAGFRLPAGGKTGTTNDSHDAWFIGFTPDVVTGVWVGFDAPREIMPRGYGATLAVPVWANFMKQSFKTSSQKEFPIPEGIVRADICAESGQLATEYCYRLTMGEDGLTSASTVYSEYFTEDTVPKYPCQKHTGFYLSSTPDDSTLPLLSGRYGFNPARQDRIANDDLSTTREPRQKKHQPEH
jgi:penicillin-binding protein 1A